jgi:probable O-glycosylation ligase (exosortase A-associated)
MTPVVGLYLLLLGWWLLSFLVNDKSDYAIGQFDKVFKIQLFTILTMMMVNTRERLNALVAVIALSIAYFGVKGGLFTLLTGGGERVWGPPSGFFEGNNELGLTLLTILPLLRYLQTEAQKSWQKHALTGAMLLCFVAAFGTHSRGALIAAFAMSLFFWYRSERKGLIALVVLIGLPLLFAFMPEKWHERMATIQVQEQTETDEYRRTLPDSSWCGRLTAKIQSHDRSAGGRINAWCYAWKRASSELIGGGFGGFNPDAFVRFAPDPYDFHDAHSIYFKILGEHGFPGLLIFLALLATAFFRVGALRRKAIQNNIVWARQFASMWQVSMIAFGTGGLFLGLSYFDLLYHLIAMSVVLEVLMRQPQIVAAAAPDTAAQKRFANSLPAEGSTT